MQNNNLENADRHVEVETNQQQLEALLTRILARVPPIISPPKAGERCQYTSKPRTFLIELIAPCARNGFKPPVKAIYKKTHRHAQRGQWLIPSENLFRYLLGLSETCVQDYLQTRNERLEDKAAVLPKASISAEGRDLKRKKGGVPPPLKGGGRQ